MSENTTSFGLSPQQRRVWRLEQQHPKLPWRTTGVVRIRGDLEPDALGRALDAAVADCEILRTAFRMLPGTSTPVQAVVDATTRLELVDLSAEPEQHRSARFDEVREAFGAAAFDLEGGQVLHACLVRHAEGEHTLLLGCPALAGDAPSIDAVTALVAEKLSGAAPAPEVSDEEGEDGPLQYADLAQWLHDLFESEDAEEGLAFWRRADAEKPPTARLPAERQPASSGATRLGRVRASVDGALHAALETYADDKELSTSTLYQAAFSIVLSRLTGASTVVLATGLHGRSYEGLPSTPGLFWKSAALGSSVDPEESFASLAARLDASVDEALEWQEYYDADRSAGGAELEPDAFAFAYHTSLELPDVPGLELDVRERTSLTEPFRLRLACDEHGDGVGLVLDFDAELIGEQDVECLARQLVRLLAAIAESPDAPVARLSMLGEEEQRTILERFAHGPSFESRAGTVTDWLYAQATRLPNQPAVVTAQGSLTYAELDAASSRLARHLQAAGVEAGTFVGIHLDRSPELMVAIVGVQKAGGAYVPLPHGYPADRLGFMAEDSGAKVVLTRSSIQAELPETKARVVVMDADADVIEALDDGPLGMSPAADDPAYMIYTSGSTGTPKGVVVTHANLAASTNARVAHYGEGLKSYLLLASVAFDSSVAGIFWTLAEGGKLVLPPDGFEEELASLPALIAREGITHMLGLPSLYGVVLESAAPGQLASLETVIVAGEACTPTLIEQHFEAYPRASLFNEYGPTEATVWSTVHDCAEGRGRYRVPIGHPIPGARVYVLDADRAPAPLGVPGELYVGGPGVARGYLGRSELTEERFVADPFTGEAGARLYRTGDLARFLPNGEIEFLGRVDSQVKIRGYRIELGEIEDVLSRAVGVGECAVMAREDANGVARIVAYLTMEDGVPADEAARASELRTHVGATLPEYMLPAGIVFLPEMPHLPNGKVDRGRLPEELGADGRATEYVEPRTPLERVLAEVWADVLGLSKVGAHDDFFDLGGHSIVATRVYARIRDTLQVELPLRALFEHSTVAGLAEVLLENESERERIEKTAELLVRYADLTDEELAEEVKG